MPHSKDNPVFFKTLSAALFSGLLSCSPSDQRQGALHPPSPSPDGAAVDASSDSASATDSDDLTDSPSKDTAGRDVLPLSSPTVSPPSGTYSYGTPISLATETPNSVTYYTLDGSPPNAGSKRYLSPIRLAPAICPGQSVTLRAVTVSADSNVSPSASATYSLDSGMVVHFKKPNEWNTAFLHYWATAPDNLSSSWPGEAMTPEGGNWYYHVLRAQTSADIVFNSGGQPQTRDLVWNRREGWFQNDEWWDGDPAFMDRFTFPQGKQKALILSWDDGHVQDRRLVSLLNQYGLKGSFHLNSGWLDTDSYLKSGELQALFAGHEVASHTVDHPYLTSLGADQIKKEIQDDRTTLQNLLGYPIRGFSYPFGDYNQGVLDLLPALGIEYARVVSTTNQLWLPGSLLEWRGTCHHSGATAIVDSFLQWNQPEMALLFVWGHSHELDQNLTFNSWPYIEGLFQRLTGRDDVWYSTAIAVADYVNAIRSVQLSRSADTIFNPSSTTAVWMRTLTGVVELKPGQSVPL